MKFLPDNNIRFGLDSEEYVGIPTSVDFVVEKLNGEFYRLIAHGYGEMSKGPDAYGDGPLYVRGLTEDQKRLFNKFAIPSQSTNLPQDKIL